MVPHKDDIKRTRFLGLKDGIPVIGVYRKPNGTCYFWCKFCGKFHKHGHGEGYRVAHCTTTHSPFLNSGYILKDFDEPAPKIESHYPIWPGAFSVKPNESME